MTKVLCFIVIFYSLSSSALAQQFPICPDESYFTVEADNGVRYGWYNDESCVFQSTTTATSYPTCPDETYFTVQGENGIQYGWYNDATCVAEAVSFELPECPNSSYYTVTGDNGVNYGWFNGQSCVLVTSDDLTDPTEAEILPQSLVATDGTTISSESMFCTYDQGAGFSDIGLSDESSLILRFLTSTGDFAFDLSIQNPTPASPFSAVASEQNIFYFSAGTSISATFGNVIDGIYNGFLTNGELELQLDSLPSPTDLAEGDVVPLKGNILINDFVLNEVVVDGLEGRNRQLELASQTLEVNCEARFSFVSPLFD